MALPGGLAQHQQQLVASKGCAMRPCLGRSVLVTPSAGRRLPVALKASSDGPTPAAATSTAPAGSRGRGAKGGDASGSSQPHPQQGHAAPQGRGAPPPHQPTSAQDLKQKYAFLVRKQLASPAGFSLQTQAKPSKSAAGKEDSSSSADAGANGLVRVKPLPSLWEDLQVRAKLQKFMAAHGETEKQQQQGAAPASQSNTAQDSPAPAQPQKQQQQQGQQVLGKVARAPWPSTLFAAEQRAPGTSTSAAVSSPAAATAAPSPLTQAAAASSAATASSPERSAAAQTPGGASAQEGSAEDASTSGDAPTRTFSLSERRLQDEQFVGSMSSKADTMRSELLGSIAAALASTAASLADSQQQQQRQQQRRDASDNTASSSRSTKDSSTAKARAWSRLGLGSSSSSSSTSSSSSAAAAAKAQSAEPLPSPLPSPAPAPGTRPRSGPRRVTPLSTTRLPSMAYPRWRPVPSAVSRRLLRLRSADYDLDARRGYTRRLDGLVRQRRAAAAARVAKAEAGKSAAAAAAAGTAAAAGATAVAATAAAAASASAPSSAQGTGLVSEGAGEQVQQPDWGAYHAGVEAVNAQLQRLLAVAPGLRTAQAYALSADAAWSLPLKAYYGRRGEQLAAMSGDDVEKQVGLWVDVAGTDYTRRFLEKEPTLLTRHPAWLLQGLETFNQVLDLEPDKCVQFALRNSALLGVGKERLQDVIVQVSEALEMTLPEARRLVVRNTTLVTQTDAGSVRERMEVLATLLPVSRSRLALIVKQRPALLTQSAVRLALAISELSNATRLPLFNAALLAAGQPGLLGLSRDVIRARMARLRALASMYDPWAEQLDAAPPAALARCLVASDTAVERLAVCLGLRPGQEVPAPAPPAAAAAANEGAGTAFNGSSAVGAAPSAALSKAAGSMHEARGVGAGSQAPAAAVQVAPRARNVKLHRILSMTEDAFKALLRPLATPRQAERPEAQARVGAGGRLPAGTPMHGQGAVVRLGGVAEGSAGVASASASALGNAPLVSFSGTREQAVAA